MPDVLGLVPTLGRGPLVHEPFGAAPLFLAAVEILSGLANPPVMVVIGPRQARLREAMASHVTIVDVAECPQDEDRVRATIAGADFVVIHDPLCPLVPARFVRQLLLKARSRRVMVGVRPVVDTIKATINGAIAGTVDRDALRIVSSPVVVPGSRLAGVPDLTTALTHLGLLVQALRMDGGVELVVAPSSSRRVEDRSGLLLMASVDAVAHRTRER